MRLGFILGIAMGGLALVSLLPTFLFLYVEPRGRNAWAQEGDSPSTRRAPALVRAAAWMSFFLGQLAIPWLVFPIVCGVLLYTQARLGIWKPAAMASTAMAGVLALVQSALAVRLLPIGVRLLMRDAPRVALVGARAPAVAIANACVLGGAAALGWAMASAPSFVHPWLGVALDRAVLRPEIVYGGLCLIHAVVLGQCARVAKT